jgi:cardiolipin synthase
LIQDIDEARQSVHLLYYIFEDDVAGQSVAAALIRAERRGVQARLLVDALASRGARKKLLPELRGAGVEAYEMLPVGLFARRLARFDVRNHRKLAVIDGRIGYVGSQNIVDKNFKPGIIYEELVARVSGPVVAELQCLFADDWYLTTSRALEGADCFQEPSRTGNAFAQLLPSGPGYPTENNQRLFVAFIHGARERVVITTPYFIPDDALLQAMQTAVLRGVDVRLVVPYKADQILVGWAQRSYYEELLEAGVKIHQYREHFLHAKHLSIDDSVAIIGSSNMDLRSFALNLEVSLILYDREVTARLRHEQERYFAGSTLLTKEYWAKRSVLKKTGQNIARLFSPLL